jgi:integrase
MLGHSTIATTLNLYTHDDLEEQEEALAKMERILNKKTV